MQRIFYTLIAVLISSGVAFGQTFSVSGKVTDIRGNALTGAVVSASGNSAVTNAFGAFRLDGLTSNDSTVTVSLLGYERFTASISPTNNSLNVTLKPTAVNLSEVKISGARSITQTELISSVDKQLRPVNTAQDLLRLVPGLFIAQHAGGGKAEQIFLRGFDCDHGTDFFISIDGMPVNMVSHAHGQGYADFHFVIPETVDKLKVYKGPYNARFGDFSTSGTGEFTTKNSLESNVVKAEVGMFDTYRGLAMIKLLDKRHLLSKQKENAYIAGEYVFTNAYFDAKQNFHRYNLFGKYDGALTSKTFLSLTSSTFSADWDASGQVPQRAVDEGLISRYGSIDNSEGGQTQRTNANAILTTSLGNGALVKNQIYFVNYGFNLFSNFTFFLNDSVNGDEINQTDHRNIFGYSGSYETEQRLGGKPLHSTLGIGTRNDFATISLKHTRQRVVLDTVVAGDVKEHNVNAFVDETLDVNKHFSINTGARVDYFDFQFNSAFNDSTSGKKNIVRVSPKLNFFFPVNDALQFFVKSGIGFHSNDARAVVVNHVSNSLPKAYGAEAGSEFKLFKRMLLNISLWELYMESELVYVGDEGTVETNTPTQRIGADFGVRYQIVKHLFADVDLNYSHGRLVGVPDGENFIPLAPRLTSIGGLAYKQPRGFSVSLRYRYIDSRPANETNSVVAKGYFLLDGVLNYTLPHFEFGVSAENLLNTAWNQAQFDTESRLQNEPQPVSELHFTPGTPFFLKGTVAVKF